MINEWAACQSLYKQVKSISIDAAKPHHTVYLYDSWSELSARKLWCSMNSNPSSTTFIPKMIFNSFWIPFFSMIIGLLKLQSHQCSGGLQQGYSRSQTKIRVWGTGWGKHVKVSFIQRKNSILMNVCNFEDLWRKRNVWRWSSILMGMKRSFFFFFSKTTHIHYHLLNL